MSAKRAGLYARVSTSDQKTGLDRMMAAARNGELSSVTVYSFSRFARSTTHLLSALEEFQKLGINFTSITERIDTNSPMGKAFFTVIAAISILERESIIERVKNGLKNAKAKGKHIGRKKTRPSEINRAMIKGGATLRETARICKTSHGSVSLEKRLMVQEERERERIERETAGKLAAGETLVLDESMPWA